MIEPGSGPGARRLALASLGLVAALAAALLAAPPPAADGRTEVPVRARLATTGNDSELRPAIPITRPSTARERTAMSLGPDDLPRLAAGDVLRVSAEVQVSTTCLANGKRCVGRPYHYTPTVTARLLLAAGRNPRAPSVQIGEPVQVRCKQQRPDRNHHCPIVLPNIDYAFDPATAPCAGNECFVNLALSAHNPRARKGHKLVLGADRPNGTVAQGKGRLNAIRIRPWTPSPRHLASEFPVVDSLPLTEGKKVKRRVIHSVELRNAVRGEVLSFDAGYIADIDHLPYNVYIATRVIVTDSPTATVPNGVGKRASFLRGRATEANGPNCTQGPSGYQSPCELTKAGAIRIGRDAVDEAGNPVPIYLNLVASAEPRLVARPKRHQRAIIRPSTGLRVDRFIPPDRG